jgi:tetratricopeptide (TPR) repeat protein
MMLTIFVSLLIILSVLLPERIQDSKQKKTAALGLVFAALVLLWCGYALQAAKTGKLEKLADQVRYGELIAEGKKQYSGKKLEEVRKTSEALIAKKQGYGYFLRGVLAIDQGKLDEAEADLKKALELGMPGEEAPYAWLNLGNAAVKRKDFTLARQHFSEALKLDSGFEPARVNLDAIDAWEGKKIVDKYAWGQA